MASKVWVRAIVVCRRARACSLRPRSDKRKVVVRPRPTGTGSTGTTGTAERERSAPPGPAPPHEPNLSHAAHRQHPAAHLRQRPRDAGRWHSASGTGGHRDRLQRQRAWRGLHRRQGLFRIRTRFAQQRDDSGRQRVRLLSNNDPASGLSMPDHRRRFRHRRSAELVDSAERKYMGCDLQAKLNGYRSQTVSLAGRRPMDDPNVGTILLHRNGPAEEGKTVSMVSLQAPKDAKKAYDKGMDVGQEEQVRGRAKELREGRGGLPELCHRVVRTRHAAGRPGQDGYGALSTSRSRSTAIPSSSARTCNSPMIAMQASKWSGTRSGHR